MSKRRWALCIIGILLLAILAFMLYVANRGGHYEVYQPSSFPHLIPTASDSTSRREVLVQISTGTLRGALIGTAIAYRGIPYAQPPVGALRWQPPQPPLHWQGVRQASQPGTACTQPAASLTPFFDAMAQGVWIEVRAAAAQVFRRLPLPQCLDAGRGAGSASAGHGVAAWGQQHPGHRRATDV